MAENMRLFSEAPASLKSKSSGGENAPLAERLRPKDWEDFVGIEQLDKPLLDQLRSGSGKPPSMILWGPPGSGKTTLARLIGNTFDCEFVEFSAVLGGVKEVREIIKHARLNPRQTLLFVDEIHRFNKGQQDAFLPHVEQGTVTLIGATTENPSFYLTGALLSRARVLVLPGLQEEDLLKLLARACDAQAIALDERSQTMLCSASGGDARRLLNMLEGLTQVYRDQKDFEEAQVKEFLGSDTAAVYDRSGEAHYNMISAFIKSMRGSDPDAALYWGFRMMDSGEDPRFIIRRMMIFASEDIGNADPRALQVAVSVSEAYEKLGLPEGSIPIAQGITYLSTAPKSNRSYKAMHAARDAVRQHPYVAVPIHLRNAPTRLMKDIGYGENYEYPHDADDAYVKNVQYLPDEMKDARFYQPSDRGYESRIAERMQFWLRKK